MWGALEASVLVSYGDELVLGVYPAGLYAYDGSAWRRIYEPREPGFSAWSYEVFRDKLYVGAGTLRHGLVLEYDGKRGREILEVWESSRCGIGLEVGAGSSRL